jgi:hypothetical protein
MLNRIADHPPSWWAHLARVLHRALVLAQGSIQCFRG